MDHAKHNNLMFQDNMANINPGTYNILILARGAWFCGGTFNNGAPFGGFATFAGGNLFAAANNSVEVDILGNKNKAKENKKCARCSDNVMCCSDNATAAHNTPSFEM